MQGKIHFQQRLVPLHWRKRRGLVSRPALLGSNPTVPTARRVRTQPPLLITRGGPKGHVLKTSCFTNMSFLKCDVSGRLGIIFLVAICACGCGVYIPALQLANHHTARRVIPLSSAPPQCWIWSSDFGFWYQHRVRLPSLLQCEGQWVRTPLACAGDLR